VGTDGIVIPATFLPNQVVINLGGVVSVQGNFLLITGPEQNSRDGKLILLPGETGLICVARSKYGSFAQQKLVIGNDRLISRDRHAVISWCSGKDFAIEDGGSTNGTFINGRSIPPHARCVFYPRDVILVGSTTIRLLIDPEITTELANT
jgi:hypothetical protein